MKKNISDTKNEKKSDVLFTLESLRRICVYVCVLFSNGQRNPCLCIKPWTTILRQHIEFAYTKYNVKYIYVLYE